MSTNDDSASRRGRRAGEGESGWPASSGQHRDEGWDQPPSGSRDSGNPYQGDQNRERQPQQPTWSGYTGSSYSQQHYRQPREEQTLPPPPPQPAYGAPRAAGGPYQDWPQQRPDVPRFAGAEAPHVPPPPPYDPAPQHFTYGDDLFTRDQSPLGYGERPAAGRPGHRAGNFDQPPARAPMTQPEPLRREEQGYFSKEAAAPSPAEDYERGFAGRIATQEGQASRFFLPDEPPAPQQRPAPRMERGFTPQQPPAEHGYASAQPYDPGAYTHEDAHPGYGQDPFDPPAGAENWHEEEPGYHGEAEEAGHSALALRQNEFDEDFFAGEDEFEEDDHSAQRRRGRGKLAALLLSGTAVAALGAGYAYKTMTGGASRSGTPLIAADSRPTKEAPGNPGGKQYPHGEKTIYDRLGPDGQTASFAPTAAPPPAIVPAAAPAVASPASSGGGSSLEDRIDEALKRARGSGDAPPPPAPPSPGRMSPDQPTVVRSESYRSDGTRVDSRPTLTPGTSSGTNGLPYPFGNAVPPAAAAPAPAQPQPAAPKAAPARMAAAAPAAPASASGYYVSLKSSPDEKAILQDIPKLTDKFKSVLGEVQIVSKVADLGAKGVTYRAVAGPLGSQQEAHDLCQKIKGVGGDKACFVTK